MCLRVSFRGCVWFLIKAVVIAVNSGLLLLIISILKIRRDMNLAAHFLPWK